MNEERNIINRVLNAQLDVDAADDLIRDYFPFIKSETAKTIGRIPVEGKDDEFSIALMGFHEAIENYEQSKGAFLKFASLVIKRRIVDFLRQENQCKYQMHLEEGALDEDMEVTGHRSDTEDVIDRESVKWEILQLTRDLQVLGITISDVAADCPKYDKVINSCRDVINYIVDHPQMMSGILENGKLPLRKIVEETKVKKKTLEKHRRYLIAMAVIYFNGYDCLINHLAEVFKSKKGGK